MQLRTLHEKKKTRIENGDAALFGIKIMPNNAEIELIFSIEIGVYDTMNR